MMKRREMPESLKRIRHSLAHILAEAVLEIRPKAQLGFGPATDTGFFYDFLLEEPIGADELPAIEERMREIIKKGISFERQEFSPEEAVALLEERSEQLKIEYCKDLVEVQGQTSLSFYQSGSFLDMCEGPHVEKSSQIRTNAFSLDSVAGAYWRGDESRPMLTRIYGLAFENSKELREFKRLRELAKQRDHRKLGRELELFFISDQVGPGLPLWLPNGAVLIEEIEKLAKEMEFRYGYVRVVTPEITKGALYKTSGHLPYYKDSMFPPMKLEGEDDYYLRPMNCPHHHMIYASRPRSYRELPLRLAEYGHVYRYEKSGELAGLLRVRSMNMNDSHMYCMPDQVKGEFLRVLELHKFYYDLFRIEDYWVRLSLHDSDSWKFAGNAETWARTEAMAREALEESGFPFDEVAGEAAFYGPKVDHQMSNVVGREETVSTTQLDLVMPERFNLTYIGPDGKEHRPVIIHRAPLSTHERFIAFLIEHLGGAFPTWLAPVQIRVFPVGADQEEYAANVVETFRDKLLRAELDTTSESLNKRIRNAELAKIPNMLILGAREQENGTITWRRKAVKAQATLPVEEFERIVLDLRDRRTMDNFADVKVPGFAE